MLINPDEIEGFSRARAFSPSRLVERVQVDNVADSVDNPLISQEQYVTVIKTAKRFHLHVNTVSIGASFHMGARMVQRLLDLTSPSLEGEIKLGRDNHCSEC
jgi:hypothetical protein